MYSQQIEKERVIAGEKTSQNMPLLPQYTLIVSVRSGFVRDFPIASVQLMRACSGPEALNLGMMYLSSLSVLWL